MPSRPTKWVTGAVCFLAALWAVGSYFDATSNLWVLLGVLSPAGHSHLWTFPAAYPAVGVTLPTLFTLAGALFVAYAGLRWATYSYKDEYASTGGTSRPGKPQERPDPSTGRSGTPESPLTRTPRPDPVTPTPSGVPLPDVPASRPTQVPPPGAADQVPASIDPDAPGASPDA